MATRVKSGTNFWQGKRVLVTGISGFVGPYLARRLVSLGAVVSGTTRNPDEAKKKHTLPAEVGLHALELKSIDATAGVLSSVQPDIIFHLAAQSSVHVSIAQPFETTETNVIGLAALLEAIRRTTPTAKLMLAGSSEVYGKVMSSEADYTWLKKHRPYFTLPVKYACEVPVSETQSFRPMSPYAVSRVHNELILQTYVSIYGLDAVIARSFNHEGAGRGAQFVTTSIIRQIQETLAKGEQTIYIGNVAAFRDWSHVEDTVQAYLTLIEKGKSGAAYNIGTGRATSVLTFLLTSLEFATGSIKQISTLGNKQKVENPLARTHHRFFGARQTSTYIDALLLEGKVRYELKDKGLRVVTTRGDFTLLFDDSRFRPADIPVLFADIKKLTRLGHKPKYCLNDIIRDMTTYEQNQH